MRVAIGSDHAGYELKSYLVAALTEAGHELVDVGCDGPQACDYPDYAAAACRAVLDGRAQLGLLMCGTGIGMSIAANKIEGIYAAHAQDSYSARVAREHNGANVLCLGGRVVGPELAREIALAFLGASVDHAERHDRRRGKLAALDKGSRRP